MSFPKIKGKKIYFGLLIDPTIDKKEETFDVKVDLLEIPSETYKPNIRQTLSTSIKNVYTGEDKDFTVRFIEKHLGCNEYRTQALPLGGFLWDKEGLKRSGNIISRLYFSSVTEKDGKFMDFGGKVIFCRKIKEDGTPLWFEAGNKKHSVAIQQMITLFKKTITPFAEVD